MWVDALRLLCSWLYVFFLVDKHEAIQILGFILVAKGLDGEAVVPCGLIDVDSA